PALEAGAPATGRAAVCPALTRPAPPYNRADKKPRAAAEYAALLPLITYENRQCGLRATKAVMMEGGVIRSDFVRHPLVTLDLATRAGLLDLARLANPLALRWGK